MAQSQFSPPARFNSSPLIRLLASLDIAPVADSTQTIAEKLSHWVAWTDAIALSRVLADSAPAQARAPGTSPTTGARQAIEQVARVRKELTQAIVQDSVLRHDGDEPGKLSDTHAPAGGRVDYAAWRRQYRAHQHAMEDRIGRLRAGVRVAMSGQSPKLRQLAALDTVLDVALAGHQRRLLHQLPQMLEKRFKAMPATHHATPDQEAELKHPVPHTHPSAMVRTWRQCLLAELDLRLQPVQGMVDTLEHNTVRAS